MVTDIKNIPDSVREEYPFAQNFIKLECGNLHYVDEGSGEINLMLHGNPSWSFLYRNLVKKLTGDSRCIVPDHIGCGLSDKPQNFNYTLSSHISNVERLIDHLKLEKFNLIVHDWGGMIGMGVAVKNPDRINKIVILNTAAFLSERIPFRINICRTPVLGEIIIRGFNGFAGAAVSMAVKKKMSEASRKGFLLPYNNWENRIATHRFVRDIPMHSSHPSYQKAKEVDESISKLSDKKMMIFWGGKDFCFNDSFFDEWCKRFPNAEKLYYKKAGHYVLEDVEEEELEKIISFLKS